MARIRSTHPGQWTAGDFLECSPLARLLALAIRNVADDHGAFRWKPTSIKAECLPADNCDIESLLSELIENDQVILYEVGGKKYGLIKDFTQWQRPKKPKYIHPVPDWFSTGTEPVPNEVATEPEILPQRKDVGGRREKKDTRSASPPKNDDFEELKRVYPRRNGNYGWKAAERKFSALVKTGVDPRAIIAAAIRLGVTLKAKIGTEFIPMPASWLNSEDFVDCAVVAFEKDDGLIEVLEQRQLDAWDSYARLQGQPTYPRNKKGGWRFPSKWPPGYEDKIIEGVQKLVASTSNLNSIHGS
jgi:hypothetical protein